MSLWYIYSLSWLLVLWFWDYIKKLVLSKWWDKDVYLIFCFIFYVLALWINFLFNWNIALISTNTVFPALIMWFFDFATPICMLASLKYLDSY